MNTKKITQLIVIMLFASSISLPSWAQKQQKIGNKINFTRFTVRTDEKRISIDWSVENTVATNYFEIQKSVDGVNFKTIALVLGPDPKQLAGDCFGCFDKYVRKNAKHSFYRLKHIDTDGAEQVSETKLLATL